MLRSRYNTCSYNVYIDLVDFLSATTLKPPIGHEIRAPRFRFLFLGIFLIKFWKCKHWGVTLLPWLLDHGAPFFDRTAHRTKLGSRFYSWLGVVVDSLSWCHSFAYISCDSNPSIHSEEQYSKCSPRTPNRASETLAIETTRRCTGDFLESSSFFSLLFSSNMF